MEVSELNNLKKLIDEKESKTLEIVNEIREKEEQARKINDKQSGFYTNIQNEIKSLNSERRKTYTELEQTRGEFDKKLENSKSELISKLKDDMELLDKNGGANKKQKINELKNRREELKNKLDMANSKVRSLKDTLTRVTMPNYQKIYKEQIDSVEKSKEALQNEFKQIEHQLNLLSKNDMLQEYLNIQNKISEIENGFNENSYEKYLNNDEVSKKTDDIQKDKNNQSEESKNTNLESSTLDSDIDSNSEKTKEDQNKEGTNTNSESSTLDSNSEKTKEDQNKEKTDTNQNPENIEKDNDTAKKEDDPNISKEETPTNNDGSYDIKFEKNDMMKSNQHCVKEINVSIGDKGIPKYLFKYDDDTRQEIEAVGPYKDYFKYYKKSFDINKNTLKSIDPILLYQIEYENPNFASQILDSIENNERISPDMLKVKYDMENIKQLPMLQRSKFRRIARNAKELGFEVENFKDVWYRRLGKGIKQSPSKILKGKDKVKQLGAAAKRRVIKKYVGYNYELEEKFKIVGNKLKNKHKSIKYNRNINKIGRQDKKLEKLDAKKERLEKRKAAMIETYGDSFYVDGNDVFNKAKEAHDAKVKAESERRTEETNINKNDFVI